MRRPGGSRVGVVRSAKLVAIGILANESGMAQLLMSFAIQTPVRSRHHAYGN